MVVPRCNMSASDAACFASFWCIMMSLRAPPLYLHDARRRKTGARSLYGSGKLGQCLLLGLVFSLITVAIPPISFSNDADDNNSNMQSSSSSSSSIAQLICFMIACGTTAIHQFNSLQSGVTQSYLLVFFGNVALTASCLASIMSSKFMTNGSDTNSDDTMLLARAVNVAAPSIIEAYALLMLFTAFGKLNPRFFDPKVTLLSSLHLFSLVSICEQPMSKCVERNIYVYIL